MTREDNITIPRWFLENVEDTLRIQNNINLDKKTGETCQDRNIKESLNGIRKLLRGEELTGGERLENLQPPLPFSLDEAAEETSQSAYSEPTADGFAKRSFFKRGFKAGAEWLAGQGVSVDASVVPYDNGLGLNMSDEDILSGIFKDGDKVIVQIRKK